LSSNSPAGIVAVVNAHNHYHYDHVDEVKHTATMTTKQRHNIPVMTSSFFERQRIKIPTKQSHLQHRNHAINAISYSYNFQDDDSMATDPENLLSAENPPSQPSLKIPVTRHEVTIDSRISHITNERP